MFYQLPHGLVSPIPSIDPLPNLFPEESPTSMFVLRPDYIYIYIYIYIYTHTQKLITLLPKEY